MERKFINIAEIEMYEDIQRFINDLKFIRFKFSDLDNLDKLELKIKNCGQTEIKRRLAILYMTIEFGLEIVIKSPVGCMSCLAEDILDVIKHSNFCDVINKKLNFSEIKLDTKYYMNIISKAISTDDEAFELALRVYDESKTLLSFIVLITKDYFGADYAIDAW